MDADSYAEICQLLSRYCHIVDEKQWDRLGEIFTADGSMDVPGRYDIHRGMAELVLLYRDKMNHPVAHNSTSVVVLDHGEGWADVVSKWVTVRSDGIAGSGVYRDRLVSTEAGWRVRERVANPA